MPFCVIIYLLMLSTFLIFMAGENRENGGERNNGKTVSDTKNFVILSKNKNVRDKRPSSFKEKTVSGLIVIAGIAAIFAGYYSFARINDPFWEGLSSNSENTNESVSTCPDGNCNLNNKLADLIELNKKDSDSDTLSDYEELYVYYTSPYLADSDSDGFSDQEEIVAGKDPNCAGSDNCFSGQSGETLVETQETQETSAQTIDSLLAGTADASAIRSVLLSAGFSAETLSGLSDGEIIAVYQEILAGETITGSETGSNEIQVNSLTDLENLTGTQIRQLLAQEGMSTTILDQLSDEDLKTIFNSQLQNQIEN